jgi:predicted enzyme related to lactoylglutathione lyase
MAEEAPASGAFVHVELPAKNPEDLKMFYGAVFGWKFEDFPDMNYTMFEAPGGLGGGIRIPDENDPRRVLNHLYVDSVSDYERKIQSNGGRIIVPKTEIPGMGWFALFQDPEGTTLGIYEANPEAPQE